MSITVNGEMLDEALIDQERAILRERYGERISPEELKTLETRIAADAKENAIERLLLLQEARKAFPAVTPGETADSLRLDSLFKQLCKDVPAPAEEECRAYYAEHQDEFKSPEMIHASHILRQPSHDQDVVAFHADMLNIREKAVRGADFAQLARQFSGCNDNGGDLGWFPRGAMVESFEKVVFALAPGRVSDVFLTEFGYHIAKVHEKRPSTPLAFEEVKENIRQTMHNERKNDRIGREVDKIRESAQIVESPDNAC